MDAQRVKTVAESARIDYERKRQTRETLIEVAFIRLLLQRLAKSE